MALVSILLPAFFFEDDSDIVRNKNSKSSFDQIVFVFFGKITAKADIKVTWDEE